LVPVSSAPSRVSYSKLKLSVETQRNYINLAERTCSCFIWQFVPFGNRLEFCAATLFPSFLSREPTRSVMSSRFSPKLRRTKRPTNNHFCLFISPMSIEMHLVTRRQTRTRTRTRKTKIAIRSTSYPPQLVALPAVPRIVGSVVNMNNALNAYSDTRVVRGRGIQGRLVMNPLIKHNDCI
jgi:hypothetical protein